MNIYYKKKLRIIFAGTPLFASKHLSMLLNLNYINIIGVITQPDRPSGRNRIISQSPVKILSSRYNIPIYQPTYFSSNFIKEIENTSVDLIVVVAYGLILPKSILKIPNLGSINIHASLLPRWRGASPIQYSILYGDIITGVTAIQMNSDVDSGNIIYKKSCTINCNDTSKTLSDKLSKIGLKVMIKAINKVSLGNCITIVQNKKKITYSKKISKKEARLNWLISAKNLEQQIRAFIPWPISYFYINKTLIKVFKAEALQNTTNSKPGEIVLANKKGIQIATKKGILNIKEIQLANKKIMPVKEVLNSKKFLFYPGNIIS